MTGTTIGHYRVLSEIGSGGMGVVYLADDLKLGRPVALKFLAETMAGNRTVHDRFLREARAAAALNHPSICTIYEINDEGPRPFLAMEYLDGQTLQQVLAAGPLPLERLLDLGVQVAAALEAAHAKGIVHRDIKPGNIFVTSDRRAKVVDFGLAKAIIAPAGSDQDAIETHLPGELSLTHEGTTVGTIAYMSPEQARGGPLDGRSDLFSFGVVLYEMATGRRAFDGATPAVAFDALLNRTPSAPSSLNPAVPPDLERIVARAIEKEPDLRYQQASEMASDLRQLRRASDQGLVAAGSGSHERPARSGTGPVSVAWTRSPGPVSVAWARPGSDPSAVPVRDVAAGRKARWLVATLAVLATLSIIAGVLAFWGPGENAEALAEGAQVLVTDFDNRTGDPDFDGTLRQALSIKLEESPHLTIVSESRSQEALRLMARKPDERVSAAVGREMCQRLGAAALMTGEVSRLGSSYVITLTAESCGTGDELARQQVDVARKEDVLGALGRASAAMRGRLGESVASLERLDKPLYEATTSSLAALKSFSLGDQKRAAGAEIEAIPFYRQAVDLDPQFALAYGRLGTVYGNLGETDQARQQYQKAFDLRDRASERERLYITAHYYSRVENDARRAAEVYELWRQTYPHDYIPVHNLGTLYASDGDFERALAAFRQAGALAPRNRLARQSQSEMLVALGRYDEARLEAERHIEDLGPAPAPHLLLYQLDYLTGDTAGMRAHAAALEGTPYDLERQQMDLDIALLEGRFTDARRLARTLAATLEARGLPERARGIEASLLVASSLAGEESVTRSGVARVAAKDPDPAIRVQLALALLTAGDVAGGSRLAAEAWGALDRESRVRQILLPSFDAMLALRQGRPARALERLDEASSGEFAETGFLVPMLRGEAHLALRDGDAAAAEFQKVIDQRGLALLDFAYAWAHLGLARARALGADKVAARQAYDRFFDLWKNADPALPVLVEARAERARLGR